MPYPWLTDDDRETIMVLAQSGETLRGIAQYLRRATSSISREIRRNSDEVNNYSAHRAQLKASARARVGRRPVRLATNRATFQFVAQATAQGHSPEQISGRIRQILPPGILPLCPNTIYRYRHRYPIDMGSKSNDPRKRPTIRSNRTRFAACGKLKIH